jgi:RNA polymerase sigma-70 factor (ECF subfamily)
MSRESERDQEEIDTIRSVLDGNRNAFRMLVERYQPAVSAVGRRMIRAGEDVKDFAQDVFLKAFLHLGQFSGSGRFYSWLMRIAYTTAINHSRRAPPEVPLDPDLMGRVWYAPRKNEPDRSVERAALWETIVAAVHDLPAHLSLSVELFFVAGLRYAEISRITGVSVNTLKSHIYRARRMLQERLDRSLLEDQDEM